MTKYLMVFGCLVAATIMESSGDALLRTGMFERKGLERVGAFVSGGALLLGYGLLLNLAPLPFDRVVGIYIATLFVVWQIVSFFAFGTTPTAPVIVGGTLIVVGGLVVAFWPPRALS